MMLPFRWASEGAYDGLPAERRRGHWLRQEAQRLEANPTALIDGTLYYF
jgi:hypothetical protein